MSAQGGKIIGNLAANAAIGATSNLLSQKNDVAYGKREYVSPWHVAVHGFSSLGMAALNVGFAYNNKKTTEQIKEDNARFKQEHINDTLGKKVISYIANEYSKDRGMSNISVKHLGSGVVKGVNEFVDDGGLGKIKNEIIYRMTK